MFDLDADLRYALEDSGQPVVYVTEDGEELTSYCLLEQAPGEINLGFNTAVTNWTLTFRYKVFPLHDQSHIRVNDVEYIVQGEPVVLEVGLLARANLKKF